MMLSTMRSEPIGSGLFGSHFVVESCEVAIADQEYQLKVRVPLGNNWYWLRQKNILGRFVWPPLRIGYRWWNWNAYVRNSFYWHDTKVLT